MSTAEVSASVTRVKGPEEELLDLIAAQTRIMPFAVFGVLIIIATLIFHYSYLGCAVWLGAVILVTMLRYVVLTRLPGMTHVSLAHRVDIVAILSGLNGVVHASSLLYFPEMTDIERAVQSLVLAGLCTGAIATTTGYSRVYLAYFLPVMPTLVVLWATDGSFELPESTDIGLALAIVVMSAVLLMLARDTERQFHESIRVRKEQEALNAQLQDALHDAGVADRAKTRFLASASHDLRQPIHALSLFGAALKMQALPDSAKELAENIDESINVLASQLDALLDISKLDAGVVAPELTTVDLSSMLERVGREFRPLVEDKGLTLQLDIASPCQVRTDKLFIERVIRNLLNNAVRYTESGSIAIRSRVEAEACRVVIEDTGIGIPASEQSRIFTEFYQVSPEQGASRQGLGLGLSIVTRLLRLLDAPITLESVPGEGTRIEVSLPRETSDEEREEVRTMPRMDDIHVLVIDDEMSVRTAMTALLRGYGATTADAGNVAQAVTCASERTPDVIVSDLRLGHESGLDAISLIREAAGTDVPAIVITGDTGSDRIREAHETGLDLLHKPVSALELEKRIASVISP